MKQETRRKPSLNRQIDGAATRAAEAVPRPETNAPPAPTPPVQLRPLAAIKVPSFADVAEREQKMPSANSRTRRLEFRATEREATAIAKRVQRTGGSQGNYLRQMALHGALSVRSPEDTLALDILDDIQAQLGRLSNRLRYAAAAHQEPQEVPGVIRDLEALRATVQRLMAKEGGGKA